MIGKISGRLDYAAADHVLIDVRGVGYIVHVSDRIIESLPPVGEQIALFTELLVREDLLQLFGFATLVEKEWHRLLMTVQGVGAKASMAMLSALGADGVSRAVTLNDWSALARAKGVGPKTAQRVVMELKDKAHAVMAIGNTKAVSLGDDVVESLAPIRLPNAVRRSAQGAAQTEALSALGNLGYSPGDAMSAVARALEVDASLATPDLIRAALRLLAPKG